VEAFGAIEERSVDVRITDIIMPGGIDGFQLAERAKMMLPDLRVLYTTGYPRQTRPADPEKLHGKLLPKPWRLYELVLVHYQV
jgi:CheY-like chemotaxis protein